MKDYFIFKSGILKRKNNTICYEYKKNNYIHNEYIPVHDIDSIYIFGESKFNTKLINFLNKNNIMIHFFNYYGNYTGTFYPNEFLLSGETIIAQSNNYSDFNKRLYIAKEFVKGAYNSMLKNLIKYGKDVPKDFFNKINILYNKIDCCSTITQLLGIEGNIRNYYYNCFKFMIYKDIEFDKRVKRPPNNKINSLISFLNSMVYSLILKEIFKTKLNPTIGYLHEPSNRRFSLTLDISEIFKPLLADTTIFSLFNSNEICDYHFENNNYLNESGKRIVIQKFYEKTKETISYKNTYISYKHLIRFELNYLIKHILNKQNYKSFKIGLE